MVFKKNPRIRNYQRTRCNLHSHDSAGEANYCVKLQLLQKAGEIKSFQSQKFFEFYIGGKKICGHRVDFLIDHNDGTQSVAEFKGFSTQLWVIKKKLFEALYPEIPYNVVTYKDLIIV